MSRRDRSTPVDPALDSLVGLHSVKGSHYAQFRGVERRLGRVIGAMDRISRALVHTGEGPETLVVSVVRAVAEHLDADWVVFALGDGELGRTGPRHLMLTGDGTVYAFEGVEIASPPRDVPDEVLNRLNDILRNQMPDPGKPLVSEHHLQVPLELDGRVVGGLAAWTSAPTTVDSADLVVMRILARQAAVALLNATLLEESRHQLARAEAAYEQVAQQAADLVARNRELELTQRQLSAAMRQRVVSEERERIARELHDSVTQSVLSAGMQIEVARGDYPDPNSQAAQRLQLAGTLTRDAVEQLRSVIYALNQAPAASGTGLGEVLEGLCSMHMPADLATDVRVIGRVRDVPDAVQHSILRIAGEALFNTAVHAQATTARLALHYRDDDIALTVDDDGTGDPAHLRRVMRAASYGDLAGRHRGLANIAARVDDHAGVFRIRRSRLGGIRIAVDLPTPANRSDLPTLTQRSDGGHRDEH